MSEKKLKKGISLFRQNRIRTISSSMLDMVLLMIPILIFGISYFGYRVLILTAVSLAGASVTEIFYRLTVWHKRPFSFDYSSFVTGILLAFLMPPSCSWYLPALGAAVGTLVGKLIWGGYDQNPLNPALVGYLFLMILFPKEMTTYVINGTTVETPMAMWLHKDMSMLPSYVSCFLGVTPGNIGETSIVLILLSGGYLMFRKVIDFRIPLTFILGFSLMTLIYHSAGFYPLVTGDVILVGMFMATDPVTAPKKKNNRWFYGFAIGLVMGFVRMFTPVPEYACFAVLLMNLLSFFLHL